MAFKIPSSLLSLLFSLCILLSIANEAAMGRSLPKDSKHEADVKEPEWLIDHHDGSVLIPGLGRVLLPPLQGHHDHHHHGHDLLHYNPITGTYGGTGSIPAPISGGSTGRPLRGYVPGGDDTLVPNPGVEVPIPGRPHPPVTGNPP